MFEQLDNLVDQLVPPLTEMGSLLDQQINLVIPGHNAVATHMGSAALAAFVEPWLNHIGEIITAIARLMQVL